MPTKKDEEAYEWITMICKKNWPISCVEDDEYRNIIKHQHLFSKKTIRSIILAMSVLVENRIGQDLQTAGYGSLLHDGWSKFGQHFFGLFATFNRKRSQKVGSSTTTITEVACVLLAMSPLTEVPADDDDDDDGQSKKRLTAEAASFTAEVHGNFIKRICFEKYGMTVEDWCVCQTADNVAVNKRVARVHLKTPHIPCGNHLLQSEVNKFIDEQRKDNEENQTSKGAASVVDSVNETMLSVRNSIVNSALVRRLTVLKPGILNKAKWQALPKCLNKFVRMYDSICTAEADPNSSIVVDSSGQFKRKVEKQAKMFNSINMVCTDLQTRMYPLKHTRRDLDQLIEESDEKFTDNTSHWYQNALGEEYIGAESEKLPDPYFVSGVCKIQMGDPNSLTEEEVEACRHLEEGEQSDGEIDNEGMSLEDKIQLNRKKRKAGTSRDRKSKYKNVDFILGSAAEVERLWSSCKHVFTAHRSTLTPVFFEAIMFLKHNQEYWDIKTVQHAFSTIIKEQREERLKKLEDEDAAYLEDESFLDSE
jgi:hypothetical protein